MQTVISWWNEIHPDNKTPMHTHIVELHQSWARYAGINPFSPKWIDANQFAKCLVAAQIADVGGWWARLDNWVPKDYEIRRAKVY